MKKAAIVLILSTLSFAQSSIPTEREDRSPERTKHKRIVFYEKDGKTVCGRMVQYGRGGWYAYIKNRISSPRFDTQEEMVKWIKAYCPVQGKAELKK